MTLKRRSFMVEEEVLERAKRVLQVDTNSEAVRMALRCAIEMDEHRQLMERTRAVLKPGSFSVP